jgi:hypothetical protein
MLHCKKITEATGRASFIAPFVAVSGPVARQSLHSYRSAGSGIVARIAARRADYGEFASAVQYLSLSNRLSSLPVACLGSASTKSID